MKIPRGEYTFTVVDSPHTARWNFWQLWGREAWEYTTFAELDRLLQPGDLFFDIGAWIGPMTLWTAKRGCRVVAVEPDPEAFVELSQNVHASGLTVARESLAVMDRDGSVALRLQGAGGDSTSSVTRETLTGDVIDVPCRTVQWLIEKHGVPAVMKMDIEGGESLVLPHCGLQLRQHGVQLLLALHPYWYAPETLPALESELQNWHIKDLTNEMYLLTPN